MTVYHIGSMEFDPESCEVSDGGHLEHLQPQVRDVLLCLIRHEGRVVTRETLIEEAWSGRLASDESITRCISLLRKTLADQGERQLIETIPGVGYRLHCPDCTDSCHHSLQYRATRRAVKTYLSMGLGVTALALIVLIMSIGPVIQFP